MYDTPTALHLLVTLEPAGPYLGSPGLLLFAGLAQVTAVGRGHLAGGREDRPADAPASPSL